MQNENNKTYRLGGTVFGQIIKVNLTRLNQEK